MASRRSRVSESMSKLKAQPEGEHDRLQIEADAVARGAALWAVIEILGVGEKPSVHDAGAGDPAGLALDIDRADAGGVEIAAGKIFGLHVGGAGADVGG